MLSSLLICRRAQILQYVWTQQRIDTFVNAIYVYEDKIILTFNDKDGTKTISLDEINGSGLDSIAAPSRKAPERVLFSFAANCWPGSAAAKRPVSGRVVF